MQPHLLHIYVVNIGALIIRIGFLIWGVPYYHDYSRIHPKPYSNLLRPPYYAGAAGACWLGFIFWRSSAEDSVKLPPKPRKVWKPQENESEKSSFSETPGSSILSQCGIVWGSG